jgi:HEAT repeat protein
LIAPYVRHPDKDVRFSVAFALGCYHADQISISVLQELIEDSDRDVHDFAIFGIGVQGNADSEELRLKFIDHLNDSFLDPRMEAAAALGKRHDKRLAKPLIEMLRKNGALNGIVEAARGLLEMSDNPEDWFEKEYIAAIVEKFPDCV